MRVYGKAEMKNLSEDYDVTQARRKMGMVFQSFNLFGPLTVIENLMQPQIDILKRSKPEAYEDGPPEQLFDHPQKQESRRFIHRLKVLELVIAKEDAYDDQQNSKRLGAYGRIGGEA